MISEYSPDERALIIADSFSELTYKQKKYFFASTNLQGDKRQKYADILIKTLGDGVYNKLRDKFSDSKYAEKVLDSLVRRAISCVTLKSGLYPEELKNIPVPPLVLYARGNVQLLSDKKVAVVGSRRSTPQALEECSKICGELTRKLTVVTGVADGADSAAIKGALASGRIIAVLPGGHDSGCAAHASLLAKVEAKGLSVSEFPPKFKAQRYTFILRNRIIAGLTGGTLVVSAAERSGALSTASYAADYGRDVLAFPYSLGVASGEGCNALIKKGAYLCENALDIFSLFGLELPVEQSPDLSAEEAAVFGAIRGGGEVHASEIARVTGKSLRDVGTICSLLEIKGLIIRTGGNKYAAV